MGCGFPNRSSSTSPTLVLSCEEVGVGGGTSGLPASSLGCGCGVVDLAHEQDAPCGMLQDQDQERPVHLHDCGHAHGHDLDGGAGGRLGSCLIDIQHGAVGHLWRNQEVQMTP